MHLDSRIRRYAGALTLALAGIAITSYDVAGQRSEQLPAADRALRPQMEDVFRIGRIDGADWEIFGERPEVAFDGAGNLYVFDPMSHRVVVFDSSGRFLRQIGRRGDGPGELRSPMGFAVMRNGTVVVADMGHASFLTFGPDGSYRRSVSFRGRDGLTVLGELHADPRGGGLFSAGRRATMIQAGAGGGARPEMPSDRSVLRFDLSSTDGPRHLFTGWGPPPSASAQAAGGGMRMGPGGMGIRAMPRAFEPGLHVAVLPNGGFVLSDSTAYDLKILSPDGRIEHTLRRPLRPSPVTPQIRRAERDRRLAELDAGRGPQVHVTGRGGAAPGGGGVPAQAQVQQMLRQQIEQLEFYPELSVITGLRTGWAGKIWVTRRGSGRTPAERGPVDVLTPAGDYLGTIAANGPRTPDAFGPNGLAAWIESDRFDTPIVVVRRLPAAVR